MKLVVAELVMNGCGVAATVWVAAVEDDAKCLNAVSHRETRQNDVQLGGEKGAQPLEMGWRRRTCVSKAWMHSAT
jgi:hypothetical protein